MWRRSGRISANFTSFMFIRTSLCDISKANSSTNDVLIVQFPKANNDLIFKIKIASVEWISQTTFLIILFTERCLEWPYCLNSGFQISPNERMLFRWQWVCILLFLDNKKQSAQITLPIFEYSLNIARSLP